MADEKIKRVCLARIVRETVTVTVSVPSDFDEWPESRREDALRELYDKHDELIDGEFEPDYEWSPEEGTHSVSDAEPDDEPKFIVLPSGDVGAIEEDEEDDEEAECVS